MPTRIGDPIVSRTAAGTGSTGFAGVLRDVLFALGESQSSIARRLGWTENTFRRYLEGRQSPSVERLAQALRRPRCPAELRRATLQWLDPGRAVETPPAVTVADLARQIAAIAEQRT